ncbi:MAG: PmoA family protein [Acidobacteria bacterium]|nr:PmoA family protein [Acidobacteriota bacterium]
MTRLLAWLLCTASLPAAGPFQFRDQGGKSLELTDGGRPVLVYNYGTLLAGGVKEQFRRSTYVHPLCAPDGTIVTDDFPKDHPHHRGLCWAWPVVRFEGRTYDVWAVEGMHQRFVRWLARETAPAQARLEVENGWFAGDRKAVRETVQLVVYPARDNRRVIGVKLILEAMDQPVEIAGREKKGYGGLNIRFAPRENTVIRTPAGVEKADSDMTVHPWAELEGVMNGRLAGARIDIDPANRDAPNGWCLRHYGYLGVNWPALGSWTLRRGRPVELNYRVTVFSAR